MANNVLEIEIKKSVNCSSDVAWWNYWDHEHLDVVHDGYKNSDIMYDKSNYLFRVDSIKVPLIPFVSFKTPIFMVQHDQNTLYTFAIQFGICSKTTIKIFRLTDNSCEIIMNYKFHFEGWKIIFKPLIKYLIPKWNEKVWLEDLPVKLRRQKVLDLNFKDFIGLPEDIEDRLKQNIYEFKLPIPRPKKSSRDRHPLSN